MNSKAKKINTFYEKDYNVVEYEYRGHTYQVTYPTNWTLCVSSPKTQHENAQWKIDKQIEDEKRQEQKEHRYEDSADYGFEVFWNYVEN